MTDCIANLIHCLNRLVWGAPALLMILAVGLYFSLRTKFLQIRKLPFALSTIGRHLRQKPQEGQVSPFQAVCTALAATVGTGNIAGVAGAIALGGPGAIFWMWIAAIIGMIVKYAEVILAVRYRERDGQGQFRGGPMYYIQNGLGPNYSVLSTLFCIFGVIAAFGVGNSTQISTAVASLQSAVSSLGGTPGPALRWAMGITMALLVGAVVVGGARRIGAVAEYLIPAMSLGYIALGFGVLIAHRGQIGSAFASIFAGAFAPRAFTGGVIGSLFTSLRIGFSRGVFTNEAGMGTASIAHAGANTRHPAEQGLYGIFEVFADTLVICTMTALVILCSPVSIPYGAADTGAELTVAAFQTVYGNWVCIFLAVSMALFAFATVLGWGLYGMRCAEFLFGVRAKKVFSLLHAIMCVVGALVSPAILWDLAETVNGLMAIPNLVALAKLSPEVLRLTSSYFTKRTEKEEFRADTRKTCP